MFRCRYIISLATAELQTANLPYFQRKIQLSGFPAYPDGSAFQLIRIKGVLLYYFQYSPYNDLHYVRVNYRPSIMADSPNMSISIPYGAML
jgi:hypothetical protein